MKKYSIFALVIVLTAALFTGCGCTNRNMDGTTSAPTLMPTNETTRATTEATTNTTSEPTTDMTSVPTDAGTNSTNETIDNGNGPLDSTGAAGANADAGTNQGGANG